MDQEVGGDRLRDAADELPEPEKDGRGATGLDKIDVPTADELRAAGKEEFDEIKDKTFLLLRKRLEHAINNPGRQGRIEDTHLISLATNLLKIDASRKSKTDEDARPRTVTNIINLTAGLPAERRAELLATAIRQMEAAGRDASDQRLALTDVLQSADAMERMLAIEA